jgi:predicted RNA-binding Zn ribbon-like protein
MPVWEKGRARSWTSTTSDGGRADRARRRAKPGATLSCFSASSTPTTTTSRPSGIASAPRRGPRRGCDRRASWRPATESRRRRGPPARAREAIRALAIANQGGPPGAAATEVIRRASAGAQLSVAIDDAGRTALEPARRGVDGAVATLLGILHEAQLTGHWSRLKGCRQCGYAFFDRSKNRSAAWCSMSICGNRTKNRRTTGAAVAPRDEAGSTPPHPPGAAAGLAVRPSCRSSSARAAARSTSWSWRRPT